MRKDRFFSDMVFYSQSLCKVGWLGLLAVLVLTWLSQDFFSGRALLIGSVINLPVLAFTLFLFVFFCYSVLLSIGLHVRPLFWIGIFLLAGMIVYFFLAGAILNFAPA